MSKSVVVVGGGLGGLSAAIHARLLGHQVTLLEKSDRLGGKAAAVQADGFRFDPGPSIIILPEIYDSVFQMAGRQPADYLRFQRLDPFSRVFFEGMQPFDLPGDRDACLDALCELFPADSDSMRYLMRRLDGIAKIVRKTIFSRPYDQFWKLLDPRLIRIGTGLGIGRKYKDFIDGLFVSPPLRAFFYGFPSYGGQTYRDVSPGSLLIPYFMIDGGVFYPEGGVSAIPASFHCLANELGVKIITRAEVTGLEIDGGRIRSVKTPEEAYRADAVISNVDRFTFGRLLGRAPVGEPSLSYFTVNLGIKGYVSNLSHHNLFIPKSFERSFEELYDQEMFPSSPIVYANLTSKIDSTVAPDGSSNLFLVVTCPAEVQNIDWPAFSQEARHRALATIKSFGFDFIEQNIQVEQVQTPQTFRVRDGNFRGSLYGLESRQRLFGMMPERNWDGEISNLYYCGGSVQPGAGLPMVTLSGKFAAALL